MTKFIQRKFYETKRESLRARARRRIRIGHISLNILLLVVIIVMGFSYLFYINQTATGGFDIKGLENNIEQLNKQSKQLEIETAQLQSLVVLEQASQELNMVATTNIKYLPAVGSSMAVR